MDNPRRTMKFVDRLIQESSDRLPSVLSLLLVNALPLVGVLFFGWSAFDVVILYWTENVVIGLINVLKMLTCWPAPLSADERMQQYKRDLSKQQIRDIAELRAIASMPGQVAWQASKLFFIPFFTIHYGMFCAGHGFFICALLGPGGMKGDLDPFSTMSAALAKPGMVLATIVLAASHLFSYFRNYLGRGEYRRVSPPVLMFQPYARVVILHLAILFGGFLAAGLGSPVWLLVLLVVGKTLLDLVMHLREHRDPPTPLTERGAMTTA